METECPHLDDYTSFPPEVVRVKDKQLQCSGNFVSIISIYLSCGKVVFIPPVICFHLECSHSHSLWMCLTCGKLYCGRYVNGHALQHYQIHNDHKVTISTETASLYWFVFILIYNSLVNSLSA